MSLSDNARRLADGSWRLLVLAAILHFAVTVTVYELGRQAVFPSFFDAHGIAVSIASDGVEVRQDAAYLSESLSRGQFRDWFFDWYPSHVRLYSISFAILSPWLAPSILSAEPLNVLCYLSILCFIFQIGKHVFDRRAGLLAALMVGLWPSFLLHSTQLLKDQLYLAGMLAFIFINLFLLSNKYSWRKGILAVLGGGLFAVVTWIVRDSMAVFMIAAVALSLALLVVKQVREKHLLLANLGSLGLLLVLCLVTIQFVPHYHTPYGAKGEVQALEEDAATVAARRERRFQQQIFEQQKGKTRSIAGTVVEVRRRFAIEAIDANSNIDLSVQLNSPTDVLRYIPRAIAIGLFAPFPNMWFAKQPNSVARRLSGLEMIALYLVEALAMIALLSSRRAPQCYSVWWLALFALLGVMTLGLTMVNLGTLFRFRYLFLFLLIELAAGGAWQVFEGWRDKRRILEPRQ